MKVLGIDIGNFGVKTNEGLYIPSKVKTFSSIFNENGIYSTYDNKKYIVGTGNYETETRKSNKENFYPLLLTSLAKSLPLTENVVNLSIGLPLNQYNNKKDSLKKDILTKYRQYNINIDNVDRTIIIDDLLIVPEAIGALYGIDTEIDINNIVLADIGGLTTNILEVDNGVIKNDLTLDIGTLQLYNKLNSLLKNDFVDLKLTYDKLDKILIEKTFLYYGETINAEKYINALYPFMNELYNTLKMSYSIENSPLMICGGGAKYFYDLLKNKIKNVEICLDVFANAKGYKIIADEYFKKNY